jgi:hypothetical protein
VTEISGVMLPSYDVAPGFRSFDISRDGRFLVNVTTQEEMEPITVIHNWAAGLKR